MLLKLAHLEKKTVFGGNDALNNNLWKYDIPNNKWEELRINLETNRTGCLQAMVNEKAYIFSDGKMLEFNCITQQIRILFPQYHNIPKYNCEQYSAFAIEDTIYMFGGWFEGVHPEKKNKVTQITKLLFAFHVPTCTMYHINVKQNEAYQTMTGKQQGIWLEEDGICYQVLF